jgi:hypothetical protein
MKVQNLHSTDLFLYEFTIKILGALATYQFGMLFIAGMFE